MPAASLQHRFDLARPLVLVLAVLSLHAWTSPPPAHAAKRRPKKYSLSVSLSAQKVVIDDEFTLSIRVDGVYEKFVDPPLADFQIVERFSKARNVLKDGKPDEYHEIGFRLRPRKIGVLIIGPAQMLVGGKVVAKSAPVTLEVVNPPGPTTAAVARKLERHASQRAFLHAYSDYDTYEVGEPFVLSWDLYYRPDVIVTPVNVHTRPRLGGLQSRETQLQPGAPELVTIAGRKFFKVAYSRQVLVAKAPVEELVVDPMKINASFDARFSKARLRSASYSIQIKSLPKEGRPDWFRPGNVGRLEVKVTYLYLSGEKGAEPIAAIPKTLVADDFIIIDAEVSGTGNLHGIAAPLLDGAARFEVVSLTPRKNNVITVSSTGIRGKRFYRFRLRPKEVGSYATPRVQFAYYDPSTSRYHTLTTKGRMISVNQTMRSVFGGITLENMELNAVRAEVGWPFVRVSYTIPVEKDLDASPQIAFFYGVNSSVRLIGLELGTEIRWNFWKDGLLSAALVPDPALLIVIPTVSGKSGEIGLRFGIPAVTFGFQVTSTINLFFGARIPLWMTLGPNPEVWLPIIADLGVEFQIHRTDDAVVNLSVGVSGGPAICLNRCPGPTVEFGLRAFVGGAIVW